MCELISILQSSIKTHDLEQRNRRNGISILQSSIKTNPASCSAFRFASFQFYKVRLKRIRITNAALMEEFQFYKVRLKPVTTPSQPGNYIFQFYKVRLKLARLHDKLQRMLISILQSSIKTWRTSRKPLRGRTISILQSSIKTWMAAIRAPTT